MAEETNREDGQKELVGGFFQLMIFCSQHKFEWIHSFPYSPITATIVKFRYVHAATATAAGQVVAVAAAGVVVTLCAVLLLRFLFFTV